MEQRKKFHFDNSYRENPLLYEDIVLYQIGDLSCEGDYAVGEHLQYCYEISYIVSGKGVYYVNGSPYLVKKGDIFLNHPGESHDCIADSIDPFRYFYFGFGFKNGGVGNDLKVIREMFDRLTVPVRQDRYDIDAPFLNIFREIINLKSHSELMIKTYLNQIIVLAFRNFYEDAEYRYAPQGEEEKSKLIVYQVTHYIDMNILSIGDLSVIGERIGYSYSYLSRLFSANMGLSIQEYYRKKKFDIAMELLKNSALSITQIAEKLHYQTIHSFSKAFRDQFGLSPTEYQGLHKKSNSEQCQVKAE